VKQWPHAKVQSEYWLWTTTQIFREGLATILGTQPDMRLVAQASNGREAIQQFREQRPDITLIDLQMPGMNGLQTMELICNEFPEAKIIILTTYVGDVQETMRLGARAYLVKSLLSKELLPTIRAVQAGK
jgi:DNA-binding NarL/FixJ family response regulator